MFRDLGMRFSKYNQRHALAGVSDIIDQRKQLYQISLEVKKID